MDHTGLLNETVSYRRWCGLELRNETVPYSPAPGKELGIVTDTEIGLRGLDPSEPRGPRRGTERREAICEAVFELLGEVGYDRMTMDAVAMRARASKATGSIGEYLRFETAS